jgi:predicted ATP-dependent endonuclease of OLD family
MIEQLHLRNFAAFADMKLDLSPKINVIIGENGTGKTQLLKALYFCNKAISDQTLSADELLRTYRPHQPALKHLIGDKGSQKAEIECTMGAGQVVKAAFSANSKALAQNEFKSTPEVAQPLLIPAKEVASFLKAMKSQKLSSEQKNALFDQTYVDLIDKLTNSSAKDVFERIDQEPRFSETYLKLVEALGGQFNVTAIGTVFDIKFDKGVFDKIKDQKDSRRDKLTFRRARSDSVDMTAEGLRKLGNLQILLANQQLQPGAGGILLWDEPEANLNPKLMKLVVEVLLAFARNGQQVVVATHDYVLLKWFDLLTDSGKGDHVRYHALSRDEEGQVAVESNDDYKYLNTNAIANTFSELYDEEIKRSLGGQ